MLAKEDGVLTYCFEYIICFGSEFATISKTKIMDTGNNKVDKKKREEGELVYKRHIRNTL